MWILNPVIDVAWDKVDVASAIVEQREVFSECECLTAFSVINIKIHDWGGNGCTSGEKEDRLGPR